MTAKQFKRDDYVVEGKTQKVPPEERRITKEEWLRFVPDVKRALRQIEDEHGISRKDVAKVARYKPRLRAQVVTVMVDYLLSCYLVRH